MRRKRKRALLVLLVLIAVMIIMFREDAHTLLRSLSCDKNRGKTVLHDVCVGYRNGRIAGNLCKDLCNTSKLVIDQCLSHKNDNVVFSADWKGMKLILKAKKMSSHDDWESVFPDHLNQNLPELRQNFLSVMHDHVLSQLINFNNVKDHHLKRNIPPNQLLSMLYFGATLDDMERKEMQSLWYLLRQDEFFVMQLLQGSKHIPRIYGTCGQFYALQKVKTLDSYIGLALHLGPWRARVKIALELMSLVRELKSDKVFGSWEHCDIQPGNFGVAGDGILKAVDVDMMFTGEKILEVLSQQSVVCTKDEDCEFFDCASLCDTKTNTCTSRKISNNLQVVCRDLFVSKWIESGLLSNIPSRNKAKFDEILKECSAPSSRPWTELKYKRIFNTLNEYLTDELRSTNQ